MDPVMTTIEPFPVLGVQTPIKRGSVTPELFAGVWKRFESHRHEVELLSVEKRYFGVNFPTDEENITDYMAGMMVPNEFVSTFRSRRKDEVGGSAGQQQQATRGAARLYGC